MNTVAEVRLWGRSIRAVSLGDDDEVAAFEYDLDFARSDIEISPLMMPFSSHVFIFPELASEILSHRNDRRSSFADENIDPILPEWFHEYLRIKPLLSAGGLLLLTA